MFLRSVLAMIMAVVPGSAVAIGSGTLAATFINPAPGCIPSGGIVAGTTVPVCDGIGSSSISWGDPGSFGVGPSSFLFTPAPFTSVAQGVTFVLGTLRYFNGTVGTGTEITSVVLRIVSSSSTPELNNQQLLLPFNIYQTPNGGVDPIVDADFLYFSNAVQFGSFRVLEGNFATVQLLGRFGSLDNDGFGNVVSGTSGSSGFFLASLEPLPEPATLVYVATGLALVGLTRRRPR